MEIAWRCCCRCSTATTCDNIVLPAHTSTTLTVEINVVVWIVDIPELFQSQVCKIHRRLDPDYRQCPRSRKYFLLFCLLHLRTSGLNHPIMAVRPLDRTAMTHEFSQDAIVLCTAYNNRLPLSHLSCGSCSTRNNAPNILYSSGILQSPHPAVVVWILRNTCRKAD